MAGRHARAPPPATTWADDRLYAFAILSAGGALLGSCSLEGVDRKRSSANLSYWVRSSATGRGVARTAVRLLAEWGIGTLGLHRVEISMVTTNAASRAAAAGSGAVAEGVLRNKARWGGRSWDHLGITARQWSVQPRPRGGALSLVGGELAVCQPRQEAAPRPAAANGLGV